MPLSVAHLQEWFLRYADSFASPESDVAYNLFLKKEHTLRVVKEIREIAAAEHLSPGDLGIAETVALLHDVGRFEQYTRYKTFVDRKSIDHAKLGADIIARTGVLKELPAQDLQLVITAIENHNRPAIDPQLSGRSLLFCRLIRDADKLDIMHLLTAHYRETGRGNKSAVELALPAGDEISREAVADLMAGGIVRFAHVRNGNDFKLLQMAWVFDINFQHSLRKIQSRNFLSELKAALPDTDEVRKAFEFVSGELEKRLIQGNPA
jgi:putative nucleotidyltransferase with HDIG domain